MRRQLIRFCERGYLDRLSSERRSWLMGRVGSKNTAPEMIVRRLLHGNGYRYRLHVASMAGKPDIVLPSRRSVVFVHGCFWHGHGCKIGRLPKSRPEFWGPKIARNRDRDASAQRMLKGLGWRVLTVWQCETKDLSELGRRLDRFLKHSKDLRSTRAANVGRLAS